MKKILALVLVFVMLLASAAFAEGEYSYREYAFDESLIAEAGGTWTEIADFGMQFYLPDIFAVIEVSEENAAAGTLAAYATSDLSGVFSIGYGAATDMEGNSIAYIEDLAALYTALGATNVDVISVNGWLAITYMLAEQDVLGYAILFDDATQCTFNFGPASDTNVALMAGIVITTLQ